MAPKNFGLLAVGLLLSSCITSTPSSDTTATLVDKPKAMSPAARSAVDKAVLQASDLHRRAEVAARKPVKIVRVALPQGGSFTFEDRNGVAVVDDMLLGNTSDFINPDGSANRSIITALNGEHWTIREIPYAVSEAYSDAMKDIIARAIKHWEENSVFTFRKKVFDPTDPNYKEDPRFLFFLDKAHFPSVYGESPVRGCSSPVGMRRAGQVIELSEGGCQFYQAIHEIGHSLGLPHEHTRLDRDEYINLNYDLLKFPVPTNLPDDKSVDHNFYASTGRFLVGDFDFESRMLYGTRDFIGTNIRVHTKGPDGKIIKTDPGRAIGSSESVLSQIDPNNPNGRPWNKQKDRLTVANFDTIGEIYGYKKAPPERVTLKSLGGCAAPSTMIPAGAKVPEPSDKHLIPSYVKLTMIPEGSPFINTAIQLQACSSKPTPNQKWQIVEDGTIRGLAGKCLSTLGGGASDGTSVVFSMCPQKLIGAKEVERPNIPRPYPEIPAPAPAASQVWKVNDNGSITGIGGKCLSVRGNASAAKTPLEIRTCSRTLAAGQKWTLTKVAPFIPLASLAPVPSP